MSDNNYPAFGKIPRRRRLITITEKIDGTNGLISIHDLTDATYPHYEGQFETEAGRFMITAGSRNRWLKPTKQEDNHGFARWVFDNRETLLTDLGPGYHYGEWWGSNIQRTYGLINGDKRFSLFNTHRWASSVTTPFTTPALTTVPVILASVDNTDINIDLALEKLSLNGSLAQHGFMNPEGIIIFDHASRGYSKITLKNDSEWKGDKQ